MTKQEAFEKIRAILFGDEKKFSEAKTVDGMILQWEGEFVEGTALNMIAEDGNVMPAPDGTYELEDGTKITCVGGLISSIEQKENEVEVEVEMASEIETLFAKHVEQFNELLTKFNELKEKVDSYESKFAEIETIKTSTENVDEKFSKVMDVVGKLVEQPATEPIPVKTPFKTKKDKDMSLVELFHQIDKSTRKG